MTKKILLTAVAAAAIAVSVQAQTTQVNAPAGQAYTIGNTAAATAANPITYQWYRNGSPIQGATGLSYTVPAAYAYGDNVQFYRLAKTMECSGEAEKPSNTISITFQGFSTPAGCNLVIGGTCWANANLTAIGVIGSQADAYDGAFFQWNRNVAYSASDPLSPAWNATADEATTWSFNPCPNDGITSLWRLPTQAEYQQLHNSGTTWVAAGQRGAINPGRFYGYAHTTCTLPSNMQGCVFLPASGYRSPTDGALTLRGTYGTGWSSTQSSSTNGYSIAFISSSSNPANENFKASGVPVRCVR